MIETKDDPMITRDDEHNNGNDDVALIPVKRSFHKHLRAESGDIGELEPSQAS